MVELLVVFVIIGILIVLSLPVVPQAQEAARRAQRRDGLSQVGLALQNYAGDYREFPPGEVSLYDPVGAAVSPVLGIADSASSGIIKQPSDHILRTADRGCRDRRSTDHLTVIVPRSLIHRESRG